MKKKRAKKKRTKSKVGFDDWAATGKTREDTEGLPREDIPPDLGPYIVKQGRFCYVRQTKDGSVFDALGNFVAGITEEVILDDGVEQSRVFELVGKLDTETALPQVRVPVSEFAGMNWVTKLWGRRAIVHAGLATRDRLRDCIQRHSLNRAIERHVFVHSGWRQIDGRWCYLSSTGALGSPDPVQVDLGPGLQRYALPLAPEDPVGAMRTSLDLLRTKIVPAAVMVPLWGAMYRAPTANVLPIDCSIWLEGMTGAMKSTLTALALAHYGPFDRLHLPGSWTSTANALERLTFKVKDAPVVLDDWAPNGLDARELETKASRILRSVGNAQARDRLRADTSERPGYPPRGLVIATGEQRPTGQSIIARTLCLELDGGTVDREALSAAQTSAGRLSHAMSGYLLWLASQLPELGDRLTKNFVALREKAFDGAGHLRVPETVAHIALGVELGLTYAVDCGACSSIEADELDAAAWETLLGLSTRQGALILGEKPSHRYLRILHGLIAQERAVLLDREAPGDPGRRELLGWQDADSLCLLPEPAWTAVVKSARDAGELFPVRQEALRSALVKEQLLDSNDSRYTAIVKVGGRPYRVLRLRRHAVETITGEFPPAPITGDEV
jgi:hypothetical protein